MEIKMDCIKDGSLVCAKCGSLHVKLLKVGVDPKRGLTVWWGCTSCMTEFWLGMELEGKPGGTVMVSLGTGVEKLGGCHKAFAMNDVVVNMHVEV